MVKTEGGLYEIHRIRKNRYKGVKDLCGWNVFGKAAEDFHLWTLDQEKTTAMLAHALDLGVNFIDTANCYSHGTSELYIGHALKELQVARDQVVLASKVYFNEGKLKRRLFYGK